MKPTSVKHACPACGERIDIDECETGKRWDNDGNHILQYICPSCGKCTDADEIERDS